MASGPAKDARGSLLELSWGGREPFGIKGGSRRFIEDGDTLQGHAREGSFGDCLGQVLQAPADPDARRHENTAMASASQIGERLWGPTAEGDHGSGVVVGEDGVMIVEA